MIIQTKKYSVFQFVNLPPPSISNYFSRLTKTHFVTLCVSTSQKDTKGSKGGHFQQ